MELTRLFNTLALSKKQRLDTHTVDIKGIGPVHITRRKGIRRISLRIKPDGSVQVSYPWYAAQKEVLGFVVQQTEWISTHKEKMASNRHYYDLGTSISIKNHEVNIVSGGNGKLQAGLQEHRVVITIPESADTKSEPVQAFIRKVIAEVCRKEAKEYLPKRTRELAVKHGFVFQKIFIKNLKSKWGSCSSQGNINLNLALMLLPDHLIDYIILHELAHLREHNHGKGFWELLNQLTNNKARELDREIRKNYRGIS